MTKPTEQDIERALAWLRKELTPAVLRDLDAHEKAGAVPWARRLAAEFAAIREEGYIAGLERAAQIALGGNLTRSSRKPRIRPTLDNAANRAAPEWFRDRDKAVKGFGKAVATLRLQLEKQLTGVQVDAMLGPLESEYRRFISNFDNPGHDDFGV
jgi:hypothetical protein